MPSTSTVARPIVLNKNASRTVFRCVDGILVLSCQPRFFAYEDLHHPIREVRESLLELDRDDTDALQSVSNRKLERTPFGSAVSIGYNMYERVPPTYLDEFLRHNVRKTDSSLDTTEVEYTVNMVYAVMGLALQPRTQANLPVRVCFTGAGGTAAILTELIMECFDNNRDFSGDGIRKSSNGYASDVPSEGPDVAVFSINSAGRNINDRTWTDIFERWQTPGFLMDDSHCSHPFYMGTPTTRRVSASRWNRVLPVHCPCTCYNQQVSQIFQERPRVLFKAQLMYLNLLCTTDKRGSLSELWTKLPSFFHHPLRFDPGRPNVASS